MKVQLSIEYEVDDKSSELEKVVAEIIRAEADAFAEAVKKRLSDAGADVKDFRAHYG